MACIALSIFPWLRLYLPNNGCNSGSAPPSARVSAPHSAPGRRLLFLSSRLGGRNRAIFIKKKGSISSIFDKTQHHGCRPSTRHGRGQWRLKKLSYTKYLEPHDMPHVGSRTTHHCPGKRQGNCRYDYKKKYCIKHQTICPLHPKWAYLISEGCSGCRDK